MSTKDYNSIENPYNENLERVSSVSESQMAASPNYGSPEAGFEDSGNGGSGGGPAMASPNDMGEQALPSGAFEDIWLGDWIKSRNYSPKRVGFYIDGRTGYAEFTNIYVSGTIEGVILVGGEIHIPDIDTTANSFHVGSDGDLWMGATETNRTIAPVQIANTGIMQLGNIGSGDYLILDGPAQNIRSSNYVAGALGAGFSLDGDLLEVGNISARGLIRTSVFEKNTISVLGGNFLVLPGDVLDTAMTALDASTLTTKGTETFDVDDILRIKSGGEDEWLRVTGIGSAPTYTVTRDLAGDYASDTNPAWPSGVAVTNYRQSGDGGVLQTASATNAPHISVFSHTGSPWTAVDEKVRLGKLDGITDPVFGALSGYGLWTDSVYLTGAVNATSGLIGGWEIGSDYIRDSADGVGLASTVTADDDVRFWAGDTFANRATAPFRVYESGNVVMERVTASNIQGFDAIVDITGGGDYYSLDMAINKGAKNIFIREGDYTICEELWIKTGDTRIIGETRERTILKRTMLGKYNYEQYIATEGAFWNITDEGSNIFRYTYVEGGKTPRFNLLVLGARLSIHFDGMTGVPYKMDNLNTGNFTVSDAGDDWFEVLNLSGVEEDYVTLGIDTEDCYIRQSPNDISAFYGRDGARSQYSVTNPGGGTTWRYAYTGTGGNPRLDLRARAGMMVDLTESSFSSSNKGVHIITDTGTDWFEVTQSAGVIETVTSSGMYLHPRLIGSSDTRFDITCEDRDKGIYRYTWDGTGTNPYLQQLQHGDDIYINAENFSAANNKHLVVLNPTDTYFEVENISGVEEVDKTIGTGEILKTNVRMGSALTSFDITNPSAGLWRYTWNGTGTDPLIGLTVNALDNIYINADNFSSNNNSYVSYYYVWACGDDWFEIRKPEGTVESGKTIGRDEIDIMRGYSATAMGADIEIANLKFKHVGNGQSGAIRPIASMNIHDVTFQYRQNQRQGAPCLQIRGSSWTDRCVLHNCYLTANSTAVIVLSGALIEKNTIESWKGCTISTRYYPYVIGDSSSQFDITNPSGSTFRYTWNGTGTDPGIVYSFEFYSNITIYLQNAHHANNGQFEITDADTNWFEITNESGVVEFNKTMGHGFINLGIGHIDLTIRDNVLKTSFYEDSSGGLFINKPCLELTCDNAIVSSNKFPDSTVGEYQATIRTFGANNVISNNFFEGAYYRSKGLAVLVTGKGQATITNNYFENRGTAIMYDAYPSTDLVNRTIIADNKFYSEGAVYQDGILTYYMSGYRLGLTVDSNSFMGLSQAVDLDNNSDIIFTNNSAIDIDNTTNAFDLSSCEHSIISNNTAKNCYRGFDLFGLDHCTVLGNVSKSNTNSDSLTGITNSEVAHNLFI